jgi:2-iminobutanoate/2-iminopropanoate deaminase
MSTKTIVHTPSAPAAVGPYSQAVKANGFVFTAGQLGFDPASMQIVNGGVEAETRQVLTNLKAVLEAAGSGLDKVVKTTVFMQDLAEFAAMNSVYAEFFPNDPPARSTFQVAGLPRGGRVEIECVAMV